MTIKEYAYIKNENVVNIALFDNPDETLLLSFKDEFELDEIILVESKPGYAEVGGTYDQEIFFAISPYNSWVKDYEKKAWKSPVPYPDPTYETPYWWDEENIQWAEIIDPTPGGTP
jgi:hypothetical protein